MFPSCHPNEDESLLYSLAPINPTSTFLVFTVPSILVLVTDFLCLLSKIKYYFLNDRHPGRRAFTRRESPRFKKR